VALSATTTPPIVGLFTVCFESSGLPRIDDQHYRILTLADTLHVAMTGGNAQPIMGAFLDRLEAAILRHLSTEEEIMDVLSYPARADHVREHDHARRVVERLQRAFREGSMPIAYDTMEFLRSWLRPHLCGPDREHAVFLRAHRTELVNRRERWKSGTILQPDQPISSVHAMS